MKNRVRFTIEKGCFTPYFLALALFFSNCANLDAQSNLSLETINPELLDTSIQTPWFGDFGFIENDIGARFYIPRCSVPEGSELVDFDLFELGSRPSAATYPQINQFNLNIFEPPNGTISPPNALQFRVIGSGGAISRITEFSLGQNYVGIHVGSADSNQAITLYGLNAAGDVVSIDRLAKPSQHISTCMMVIAPDGEKIHAIAVGASSTLYIDRLFFSPELDMPIPPSPVNGEAAFIIPVSNAQLRTNIRQLSIGKITVPTGLEIKNLQLSYPNWDRSQTTIKEASVSKLREAGGDTTYLFFAQNIYIPEGEVIITATATGPGVIATTFVEVDGIGQAPIPEDEAQGRVDIIPITLEATQAIRGVVPSIPPGGAIKDDEDNVLVHNKPTVVRGYAYLDFPDGETFNRFLPVTARLVGERNGRALSGSPLLPRNVTSNIARFESKTTAFHNDKEKDGQFFLFELPDSWTDEGEIDLRMTVNPADSPHFIDEHPDADTNLNSIGLNSLKFRDQQTPKVAVWLVDYYYRCSAIDDDGVRPFRDDEGMTATFSSIDLCRGLAEGDIVNHKPSIWDAAESILTWWNMAPFPGHFPEIFESYDYVFVDPGADPGIPESAVTGPMLSLGSPADTNKLGVAFRMESLEATDGYGTMNVLMSDFVRGKAWGTPSFFRTSTALTTTGHEAAHTMGLLHTGNKHNETFWVTRWNDDHGEIAQNKSRASMFDVRKMRALNYRPKNSRGLYDFRHDYMSYGGFRWVSKEVWSQTFGVVNDNIPSIDNRLDDTIGVALSNIFSLGAPPKDEEIVSFSGHFEDGKLKLSQGFHQKGAIPLKFGEVEIITIDSLNNKSYSTFVQMNKRFGLSARDSINDLGFTALAYVPRSINKIVIRYKGETIYEKDVAPPNKVLSVRAPTQWLNDEAVTISWDASEDINIVKPEFRIEFSKDKETWYELATSSTLSYQFNPANLPFSGKGWFVRVQSSTGLQTSMSTTLEIEFSQKFLIPKIVYPRPGAKVSANELINMHALGSRFTEGTKQLEWWVNGELLATGSSALLPSGQAGSMDISLRSPLTGMRDDIQLEVFQDDDLDGMSNDWELANGLDPLDPSDKGSEEDEDGLVAQQEFENNTSLDNADTDMDGFNDGQEVSLGSSPMDKLSTPGIRPDGTIAEKTEVDKPNRDEVSTAPLLYWLIALVCLFALVLLVIVALKRR